MEGGHCPPLFWWAVPTLHMLFCNGGTGFQPVHRIGKMPVPPLS